jgi:hypothetical protein
MPHTEVDPATRRPKYSETSLAIEGKAERVGDELDHMLTFLAGIQPAVALAMLVVA